MENIVGLDMHKKCTHEAAANEENHQHHDEHSNHHHSCTPFCSCGIMNFVLHVPQFHTITALSIALSNKTETFQSNLWAIPANNYKKLMAKDIWHPPQTV